MNEPREPSEPSEPSDPSGASGETTPAAGQTDADDLAGLSYESARAELVEVVNQLESGGVPLDESLALWERGERLAQVCQRWLDGARAKIEATRADGADNTTPEHHLS